MAGLWIRLMIGVGVLVTLPSGLLVRGEIARAAPVVGSWQIVARNYQIEETYIVNLDGSDREALVYRRQNIAWHSCSQNGAYLVLFVPGELHVTDMSGTQRYSVYGQSLSQYMNASISNDGQRLIYEPAERAPDLLLYDHDAPAPKTPVRFSSASGSPVQPSFAADGEQLLFTVFTRLRGQAHIYRADLTQPTRQQPVTAGRQPVASPDGRYLAYTHSAGPSRDLYLLDVPRGLRVQLTHTPMYHETQPVWSPDGRSLLYRATYRGETADELAHFTVSSWDGSGGHDLDLPAASTLACFLQARPQHLVRTEDWQPEYID